MSDSMQPRVLKVPDGKVVDYIDLTLRNDTPEEYVRQTIEKRLVNEHQYSPEQIKIEFSLKLGSRRPRADIAIFRKDSSEQTQDQVWIIIECKSEKVDVTSRKNGVEQMKSYMSACPNCEWGMWTNGKHKEVWKKELIEDRYVFEEYNDIPPASGSLEDVDRPKRNKLKKAYEDNLLMVFKTCHNHIYVTDGLQKQAAFFELLKVIFCKTLDEQNVGEQLDFYTTSRERSNPDGQLTVKKRISAIFQEVKRQFPQIFDASDEIKLKDRSLAWVVSELQPYSLLKTHVDVKGKAYEELVGANLRGDRGEFFTPRNVMRMAVKMVNPQPGEKVCDATCGTGGFLVTAMNHIIDELNRRAEEDFGKSRDQWSDYERTIVRDRTSSIAASDFFGFDISPELVKATKMNMVMNNDGSGNIYQNDSLLPPRAWSLDTIEQLANALRIGPHAIRDHNSIEFFDVIVTNPPFGSKIPVKDNHILEQFDIGHKWRDKKNKDIGKTVWTRSEDCRASVPPEQLFIERNLQFLKPGGRMAIVLPDSILGNPGLGHIRQWLIKHTKIIASVDLHVDAFQPKNGTQTSVLIVQKKSDEEKSVELSSGIIRPYSIFMAMVEKVGQDKRGNTLFKRDEQGNEIWEPEQTKVLEMSKSATGQTTYREERRTRIIDDQCREVPEVFEQWKKQEGIPW